METNWGRAIAAAALGVLLGVALQVQQAELWPLLPCVGLAASALGLVALCRRRSALLVVAVSLLAAAMAFSATTLRAGWRLADTLAPALEGQDVRVRGRVLGLPQVDAQGVRFLFEVAQAERLGAAVADVPQAVRLPQRLWLHWGNGWQADALQVGPPAPVRAGEQWDLPLRLRRPHGALNPGGFDAELWLFEAGVGAVGSVPAAEAMDARRLAAARWWVPLEALAALRQRWRDQILTQVAEPRSAGLLAALAVGDQSAIDAAGWAVYRETGIAHLVSISGMHITLFAWVAAGLVNALWRRSARAMLWIPAPLAARWCGLALALAYALLAGWGLPAQRTVGMLGLTVLMRSLGAPWPPALLCLVAGALVVLWDPWALLQPGFWLSFMAVGLLIASDAGQGRMAADGMGVAPARAEPPPGDRRWRALLEAGKSGLRGQWLVTVGLAPLTLLLFQQLSLVGLLANLVAVPLVTWVVTPLALAGVAWPACWTAAGWVLQPLLAWLGWLASWPHAVWHVPAASAWAAGLALLGAALLMLPLPWRLRALAVPLCLPLLWPPVQRPAPGQFELIAADVGQGSAVIVRTAGHTLLHDAGPQFNAETDAGQRVLLPLLQSMGTTQLDELLLSHRDADHVGGAASVLAGLPVQRLRSTLDPAHPLRASPVPHLDCAAGQRWVWDGVAFEVLHPQPGAPRLGVKPNHLSCVLRVRSAAGQSALITGDLEAEQEEALVHRLGAALQSTVLLVPHHGSRTSSTPDFLAAVQPQWSVVQAAYRSRFGHPHPEVLARYQARGLALVRTDQCGAWIWQSNGATCTRDVRRRYWHWRDRPALPVAGAVVANPPTVGDRE